MHRCRCRCQINPRQQFRLVCDDAVRNAFAEAKQRYGAPRLAEELPEYNIKTIAASLRRQGLRAKASRKFSPVSYCEHGLPVSSSLSLPRTPNRGHGYRHSCLDVVPTASS